MTLDGVPLLVAVPNGDDIAPVGPLRGDDVPAVLTPPDEAVVAACSSADLLLTLVTLDPATGGEHLATWASEAIAVVTAGRSSAEKVHSAGELIRLAGTRFNSAILLGADRTDASLGLLDLPRPPTAARRNANRVTGSAAATPYLTAAATWAISCPKPPRAQGR